MTERKVLNKYYPPDYDPTKIPKLPKDSKLLKRNKVFNIRTMAPCNMRCLSCGIYIYKARKFNSRMEVAEGEDYLGLRIYRFYIRCPGCCSEITWKTDLENMDYTVEHGAKRNFEALRTAVIEEKKRAEQLEEDEAKDPMKLLEKRTKQSKVEMDLLESLEDMKELNKRMVGSDIFDEVIQSVEEKHLQLDQQVVDEDTKMARALLGVGTVKRLDSDDESDAPSTSATLSVGEMKPLVAVKRVNVESSDRKKAIELKRQKLICKKKSS